MRIRGLVSTKADIVAALLAIMLVVFLAAFALAGYGSAARSLLFTAGCLVGTILTHLLLRSFERRRLMAGLLLPVWAGAFVGKAALLSAGSGPEELAQGFLFGCMMAILWSFRGTGSRSAERGPTDP